MPTPPLSRERARLIIEAFEEVLKEGKFHADGSKPSAYRECDRRLKEIIGFTSNSYTIEALRRIEELYGWKPLEHNNFDNGDSDGERRRAIARNKQLEKEISNLHKRLHRAEDMRASVMGLVDPMPEPRHFHIPTMTHGNLPETIIVFLSDWHWGEVINLAAMDGLNSYNPAIAAKRAERCFQAIVELSTKHWVSPVHPARLIMVLGGDMISGEIHNELAKTNALLAIPAMKDCASALMGGIDLLLKSLPCPIDVIVLPGNHGRSTMKPESKGAAETSYDVLLGDLLDLHYRNEKRITFYAPVSGDALFTVDGRTFLATHGDRIGSRGGQGFVGPAQTVARGFKRVIADYTARGIILDQILCGHFHTPLQLEEGFVCGTLAGPSEFSRDGRFRPHPASQLYMTIHPRRGINQVRQIQVGSGDEGSLYEWNRSGAPERPRYRVPSIGIRK